MFSNTQATRFESGSLMVRTSDENMFNETLEDIKIDGVCSGKSNRTFSPANENSYKGMIMQHFIEKEVPPLVEEVSATNKLKEFLGFKKNYLCSKEKKLSIDSLLELLLVKRTVRLHNWVEPF